MTSAKQKTVRRSASGPRDTRSEAVRDVEVVAEFFDADFYITRYSIRPSSKFEAALHFCAGGWRKGHDPAPWFSTSYYMAQHADVAKAGVNPFVHYLQKGQAEGRLPSPNVKPLHENIQLSLVRRHFDEQYYALSYPDLMGSEDFLFDHYMTVGWKEGRDPSRSFSTNDYLLMNADVYNSNINPLLHYVLYGEAEGRTGVKPASVYVARAFLDAIGCVGSHITEDFYRSQSPNTTNPDIDPNVHYLLLGWRLGLNPTPEFHTNEYLQSYPDVRAAGVNPFVHYLENGKAEGRQPNHKVRDQIKAHFDPVYYRKFHPPLSGLSELEHFIAFGWREGRDPSPDFSINDYCQLYPDVRRANINPFWHYHDTGRAEGRVMRLSSQRSIEPSASTGSILFVGHDGIQAGAQVVLLEVVRWFAEHTRHILEVLLLKPGLMASEYAKYARVFVIADAEDAVLRRSALDQLLSRDYRLVYINTVAGLTHYDALMRPNLPKATPIILHVHEMAQVLQDFAHPVRAALDSISLTICVSDQSATDFCGAFDFDRAKVSVVNAFIRPHVATAPQVATARANARRRLDLASDTFVVMGCGSVYWRKGPDLFKDIARKARHMRGGANIEFIWIGEGRDLAELQANADGHVRFVGFHADASALLAAADLFILSSREDPFPLVCLEAAQYGIPSLFFRDATGIDRFILPDGGEAIAQFDTSDAANRVVSLSGPERARLELMGLRIRQRLLEEYTDTQICPKIAMAVRNHAAIPPEVTVIVPVFNHRAFIERRMDSILGQTLQCFDVIILDDCSTDGSDFVIDRYAADPRVRVIRNDANSGTAFRQWKKGVEATTCPLIWIAEGDDRCSDNFLQVLLPKMDDPSINIAFARTEIIDEFDSPKPGALDVYLGELDFDANLNDQTWSGPELVEKHLAAGCIIVNASSAIMRKRALGPFLPVADKFVISGDWYAYVELLRTGGAAYTTDTTNFFRRHTASVVHRIEGSTDYFKERNRVARLAVQSFHLSHRCLRRMLAFTQKEWSRFSAGHRSVTLTDFYDVPALVQAHRETFAPRLSIGIYVHGMLFSTGGIERLAALLANELAQRGHTVTIFCRTWGSDRPVYPLVSQVLVCPIFDENHLMTSVANLQVELARRNIDLFIPMLSEALFEPLIDAAVGLGIPTIASEHNDPWEIARRWWTPERRLQAFGKCAAVHLLIDRFTASLPVDWPSIVAVIPNCMPLGGKPQPPPIATRPRRIIGVGRLEEQKRFDRLISAFSLLASRFSDWTLDIYGEGSLRGVLQHQIRTLNLEERVKLRGVSTDIPGELTRSALFVMPSSFEGFGIVVIEAKDAAVPVIAYENCNGPNDLIHPGVDGLLASADEDGHNLAACMDHIMGDPAYAQTLATAGRLNLDRFSVERVADQWEALIGLAMQPAVAPVALSAPPAPKAAPVLPETSKQSSAKPTAVGRRRTVRLNQHVNHNE